MSAFKNEDRARVPRVIVSPHAAHIFAQLAAAGLAVVTDETDPQSFRLRSNARDDFGAVAAQLPTVKSLRREARRHRDPLPKAPKILGPKLGRR